MIGKTQPLKSFFQKSAEPEQVSTIELSGGAHEPYYFSLGVNSTVPFVKLEGIGGTSKEFSWNEPIEIPPNTIVHVRNASKHKGDIHIQSGTDFARPARISFPMPLVLQSRNFDGFPTYATDFIDTRTAKRAWYSFLIDYAWSADVPTEFGVVAFYEQHTANPEIVGTLLGNCAWFTSWPVAAFTAVGMYPLGKDSGLFQPDSPIPMCLPDYLRFVWSMSENLDPALNFAFVTIEYE